jgi:hypothetical protein
MTGLIRIAVKSVAAILAAISLNWLVSNIDTHGDHIQLGLQSQLESAQHPRPPAPHFETDVIYAAGLDTIDMVIVCGPVFTDISGWVGLWLVTVVVGGLPTAVLARSAANDAKR